MTRLPVKVEIAFDSTYSTAAASRTWTDVTEYALTSGSINIVHARQDENSQAGANTCSLTLNNSDGRFTPGLASGAYYPNVKVGRPLRIVTNLCTAGDNGTFEANATGWTDTNATSGRTTAQAHSGTASFSMTADTAANMQALSSAAGVVAIPVAASTPHRGSVWVRTAVTGRTVDLRVDWYDTGGSLISTSTSSSLTDSTTWQQLSVSATSPATAAYARLRVLWTSPAAGETHYLDDARLDVDRFTGYVDEWPTEWPHVVDTFATATISATSRMARLGLSSKLRSVVEQEILADSPVAYYTMGEAEGATQANDSSGNSAANLVAGTPPGGYSLPATSVAFGSEIGLATEGQTGARFAGIDGTTGHCRSLRAVNVSVSLAGIGLFFVASEARTPVAFSSLFAAGTTSADPTGQLWIGYNGGTVRVTRDGSGFIEATGVTEGELHHVFVQQDGANVRLYVDGVLASSFAATIGTLADYQFGPPAGEYNVTIAHGALFDVAPTAARIAEHADAGLTGFLDEPAHERLTRYAGYAGIPTAEQSFSTAAVTPMAHVDTTGKGPAELMQTVEATDGGVLYDGTSGLLTYQARTVRYNATAALTLDMNAGEVQVGYAPKLDRSALINKLTATLSDGTYSATAENTASVTEYGAHGPGDLELATTDADEAHAAAWWRVNTYGEPSARAPQLIVELAKMTAARQAVVLAVEVSDKVAVSNLPSQSDASSKSFFVEGYSETITDSLHTLSFNVSPATGFDVWEIEHATFGQYDAYPIAY